MNRYSPTSRQHQRNVRYKHRCYYSTALPLLKFVRQSEFRYAAASLPQPLYLLKRYYTSLIAFRVMQIEIPTVVKGI